MADSPSLVLALVAFVIGALLRRAPGFPEGVAPALHAYVVWVALPALILERVPGLAAGGEVLALILMPWGLLGLSAALVLGVARRARWPRPVEGALLMIVPLANTAFVGLPLVEAHLGPEAIPPAIVWDQLGSFLALSTYGAFVIAAYRPTGEGRPSARAMLRQVVRFPPFVALLLALVLIQTGTPPLARSVLAAFGASLIPVVMVAVGLQWRVLVPRHALGPAGFALVTRLALVPLVALGVVSALDLPPLIAGTAVLEAGMGPMITAGALAIEAGLAPELTAAVLGWGTLLSLGTTALWAGLV
jgi:predicted permease